MASKAKGYKASHMIRGQAKSGVRVSKFDAKQTVAESKKHENKGQANGNPRKSR